MKLNPIEREHILNAGEHIDLNGIPDNYLSNNYWVKLPNGREYPFKYLTRIAFQMTEGHDGEWLDFQSNESYRGYIENELKFPINYYKEGVNFITIEDIENLESVKGEKYRKSDVENLRAGRLLKPLVFKVNKWAEYSLIEDFEFRKDNRWQWSGSFKPYLWIRIYRPSSSKKVFFTLGASNEGCLFCELDCLRSNYAKTGVLSIDQQNLFDFYRNKSDYSALIIPKEEVRSLNWNKLIAKTTSYFNKYLVLYDELENIISSKHIEKKEENNIVLEVSPALTKSYVYKKRTYKGKIIDWSKKQTTSKFLGDSGEDFVVDFEKDKLMKAGLMNKVELVCREKDGSGYDIKSFDLHGNEIHIEVKTTTGKKDEPFYFSINERDFLEEHPENYFLYRLYEFKFNPNRTKYYILNANDLIEKWEFKPTNFEVSKPS